jgi:hypothetical protein
MNPTPVPDVLSLIGRQKAEFKLAARLRTRVLQAQMGIGLLGVATVFTANDTVLYAAAVVGLVLALIWLGLTIRMAEVRSHAERIRRATMIAGALGITLDGAEMLELANDGHASQADADKLHDPNYFASNAPAGVPRLVEMLEESAIWTTNLSKVAAEEAWWTFGASVLVTLLALFGGLTFFQISQVQTVGRVFFAMLVVLLSADFLGAAISYGRVRHETQRVVDRLQRLRAPGATLEAAMIVFADYNAAVEDAPVFSNGLYPRHAARLKADYQRYVAAKGPGPSAVASSEIKSK